MKLELWHKAILLSLVSVTTALFIHKEDLTNEIDVKTASDRQTTADYIITNDDCPDSLFADVHKTIIRLLHREGLRGGANVAISQGGRVVYAKGIGFSDLADSSAMEPYNVLRVASVSKLITAVAVMHLVEARKLTLDDKIFGPTGILNDSKYKTMRDPRMKNVTVRNLLNHSGGWSTKYGDPMFMPQVIADELGKTLPINMEDIINFMQCKRMHFNPGSSSVYSNFGYGILGEVVAKAAGMPYEDYVRSTVFAPLGITDAHLGYSHLEDRLPNEVAYYEPDTASRVPDYADRKKLSRRAYGGTDIHTLGSAGGWVLSAIDLIKLTLTIDGFPSVPDQLSAKSIAEMTDPNSRFQPLGWRKVIGEAWFRTGTLSATSAIICRRPDGISFVVVLNSSNSLGPNLAVLISNKMNDAINHIHYWPEGDLLAGDKRWVAYKLKNRSRQLNYQ